MEVRKTILTEVVRAPNQMNRRWDLLVSVVLVIRLDFFSFMLITPVSRVLEEEFALHFKFRILMTRGSAKACNCREENIRFEWLPNYRIHVSKSRRVV